MLQRPASRKQGAVEGKSSVLRLLEPIAEFRVRRIRQVLLD